MEKINRNLSVHFNSKLFTGIKHEDILYELKKEINLEDIKSIQMTEKSCIVTLKSEQAKYKILNSEISLPVNNLLLKCTDKFLFIFSILLECCELCLLVYKNTLNKLSGEVFSHIGWFVAVFHQIIILYIGNVRHRKAILAIFFVKHFGAGKLTIPRADHL
jgi:hypothetical protein